MFKKKNYYSPRINFSSNLTNVFLTPILITSKTGRKNTMAFKLSLSIIVIFYVIHIILSNMKYHNKYINTYITDKVDKHEVDIL